MTENGDSHADDGPVGLVDGDEGATNASRLHRVAASVGHGAGEVRRVAAATTAGAAQAFDAADVSPKLKQRASAAANRATRAAIDNPVPSAIGAAYIAGFLKGHRLARRRSR